MKRFYKKRGESELGAVTVWYEFEDGTPSRQVERYGERWYSSRKDYHPELGPGLTDQPPNVLGLRSEDETTSEEFEEAWRISGLHESA